MRPRISRHLGPVLTDVVTEAPSRETFALSRTLRGAASPRLARGGPAALVRDIAEPVSVPPEFNGRDYAIFLLRIAAEVEHSLMVQYMFSAYSLGGPRVPEDKQVEVRAWQETILGIAKEEMGHLITVQNLLTLLGAPRQFDRDDYPNTSELYPFPFRLEPLSLESLATYVCAESPADWNGAEADEIKARAHTETGADVNRVGVIFDRVIRLLEDPTAIPDSAFQASTLPFQARWDEWGRGYRENQRGVEAMSSLPDLPAPELIIMPADTRAAAVAALRAVAEQGEGLITPEDENDSHFVRFLTIYRMMNELGSGISDVVRPVAANPVANAADAGDPEDLDTPTAITHPEAVIWAHLFNVRYRKLLVNLSHAFELADDQPGSTSPTARGWLIHRVFVEMYNLRAIAGLLIRLPAKADVAPDGLRAGPPFQMPYTLALPSTEADRWRVHLDLLEATGSLIGQLRGISTFGDQQEYALALTQADQIERTQVEQFITAPVPVVGGPTP